SNAPAPAVAVAPARPAPAPPPPTAAAGPTPPAVADAAALQQQWPKIAAALRRQYDRVWARYEEAYQASGINSYRLKSLTSEEISISLEYMAHSTAGSYSAGRPRLRTQDVRFRNRAPGFVILQWGSYRVDTSVTDASQIDAHWDVIGERLVAQYDRELAVADGAVDMAGIDGYRLDRLDANEIALTVEYRVNPMAGAGAPAKTRNAEVRLRNKAPDFRIVKWGSLPVSTAEDDESIPRRPIAIASVTEAQQFWPILRRALERQYADSIRFHPAEALAGAAETGPPATMLIKRHTVTALQGERVGLAITYEVAGTNARSERDATVTLRNAGPAFEVLEWRR
ncbi:hypothetical protein, partial [Desertibaculum subflavum]|uniref:hypothetical protein n=1 Tax=Desertibaculum subflavum TaxID=2268458 RepID=UPI0034D265C8